VDAGDDGVDEDTSLIALTVYRCDLSQALRMGVNKLYSHGQLQ